MKCLVLGQPKTGNTPVNCKLSEQAWAKDKRQAASQLLKAIQPKGKTDYLPTHLAFNNSSSCRKLLKEAAGTQKKGCNAGQNPSKNLLSGHTISTVQAFPYRLLWKGSCAFKNRAFCRDNEGVCPRSTVHFARRKREPMNAPKLNPLPPPRFKKKIWRAESKSWGGVALNISPRNKQKYRCFVGYWQGFPEAHHISCPPKQKIKL